MTSRIYVRLEELSHSLKDLCESKTLSARPFRAIHQQLCSLHKEAEEELEHQQIRQIREEMKKTVSVQVDEDVWNELESDFAYEELLAEGVCFVRSHQEFSERLGVSDQELQDRIGLGLQIFDSLERLGSSAHQLIQQIHHCNVQLLARKMGPRFEELARTENWAALKNALHDFDQAVGLELAPEFFQSLRNKLPA